MGEIRERLFSEHTNFGYPRAYTPTHRRRRTRRLESSEEKFAWQPLAGGRVLVVGADDGAVIEAVVALGGVCAEAPKDATHAVVVATPGSDTLRALDRALIARCVAENVPARPARARKHTSGPAPKLYGKQYISGPAPKLYGKLRR